jgi:hypothetical protein
MTPEALAKALDNALDARMPAVERFEAYYEGEQSVAFATSKWRETFGALFNELADNWCQLVIDASVERLKVEGFRFGPEGDNADNEAWQLWQANYLDADSTLAHTDACKTGLAYVLVLPNARSRDAAHHGRVARAGDRADRARRSPQASRRAQALARRGRVRARRRLHARALLPLRTRQEPPHVAGRRLS